MFCGGGDGVGENSRFKHQTEKEKSGHFRALPIVYLHHFLRQECDSKKRLCLPTRETSTAKTSLCVYRWWLLKEAAILTINPLSEISLLLPHRLMPDEKTQLSPIKPISPLQDMPHVNMCKPVFIQRMRSSKGPRGTKETRREKPSLTGGRSR